MKIYSITNLLVLILYHGYYYYFYITLFSHSFEQFDLLDVDGWTE